MLKKFLTLLNSAQKQRAVYLVLLMFFSMILETLSVGLVVPVLIAISDPELVSQYLIIGRFIELIGSPTHNQIVLISVLCLLAMYAVKSAVLIFVIWKQYQFIFGLQRDMSKKLFSIYLTQPYIFHLKRNTAQLIRNTTTEVAQFVSALLGGTTLIAETLVVIGIGALILYIEPTGGMLIIFLLSLFSYVYYQRLKGLTKSWGEKRQYHEGMRIQAIQEGLNALKEIKLFGRENNLIRSYGKHNSETADAIRLQTVFQAIPRLLVEFIGVSCIAVLSVVLILQGTNPELLIPAIGLFAAAALRIMPSVNRILGSIQRLRYALPVIDILYEETKLEIISDGPLSKGSLTPLSRKISIDNVSYKYPHSGEVVLKNINLEILKGSKTGIIGPSGSGKTTLINIILGLIEPEEGQITVDGICIKENYKHWRTQIGYVPQDIYLTDESLAQNIALGLEKQEIDEDSVKKAVKLAHLEGFVQGLPNGLNTVVGERGTKLSGGQRQRIGIARALYNNPTILILDEATSSLDVKTEQNVMENVYGSLAEKTMILVTHRHDTIKKCDHIYSLNRGVIKQV
jgi:ABC-type multidrug transport system fused ATPase/permease subunit